VLHPAPARSDDAPTSEALRVLDILVRDLPPSTAARLAAEITGVKRAELYRIALAAKQGEDESPS
jgi:16S rRNA (cytidine1402-2'-O)-methyltransferase